MKKLALILALAVSMTTLAACSSSSSSSSTDGSATGTVKDTLIVAQGADPKGLDPQGGNESPGSRVMKQIYNTLIEQDENMELVPGLAESWEFEDDQTLTLFLREGVLFHNGETLSANDVKFTLERAIASADVGHIVNTIESVEVIDDLTVTLHLSTPFAPILSHLAHTATSIVNEKAVTEGGDFYAQNPVGTGPYKFVNWKTADSITLEIFDDYYGDKPAIQNIVFRTITENTSRAIEVETGGIDIAYDIAPSDISRIEADPNLELVRGLNFSSSYMGFNTAKAPYDDVRVRQAINYALDMDSIVEAVYYGAGKPSIGPLTETVWAANTSLDQYGYDVEKAKELLAEAGYPDGFDTTIWVNDNAQRIEIAEIAQNQLAAVGINASIEILEWATYLADTAEGKHDIFLLGWVCVTGDPDYGLYAPFHSSNFGAAGNRTFYKNDRVDELLDLGRTATSEEERYEAYQEAQQLIRDDAPWVFVQQGEDLNAVRSNVKGFVNNPAGHHKLYNVYFE